jgi:2-haloacid dehalogenase
MGAVVFDVMGTLFDLEPLRGRLEDAGAPGSALETWFARLLHGAAALTLAGTFEPFPALAATTLRSLLAQHDVDADHADEILAGLSELEPFPETAEALSRLVEGGCELLALTNGTADNTRTLLERSGLDRFVGRIATTADVEAYKPDARPYHHALAQLDVRPAEATMVAAHAWDVVGARAVGMETVWISRLERRWPLPVEPAPAAADLVAAAELVLSSAGAAPGTRRATRASAG